MIAINVLGLQATCNVLQNIPEIISPDNVVSMRKQLFRIPRLWQLLIFIVYCEQDFEDAEESFIFERILPVVIIN